MTEPRPPRESLTEILSSGARLESFWGQATRGDLLARAVSWAGAGEPLASIQATFYAEAPPEVELALVGEDLGPGRTRVRAHLGDDLLCEANVRFAWPGDGLAYQGVRPDPGLPGPDALPSETELAEREGWAPYAVGPIESRRIGEQVPVKADEPAVWLGWLRPRQALPRDARIQNAALAFLAEYRSHWAVERRLGPAFPRSTITLLDFALWVHRAERWDDWWLVQTRSDIGVGGRCLSQREIYTRSGALLASAAWEALVR